MASFRVGNTINDEREWKGDKWKMRKWSGKEKK